MAKGRQIEATKLMVACASPYVCMAMTERERDNVLSSGPARFQLLSAFHPSLTSRQSGNLGSKLATSFPRPLFDIMIKSNSKV